MKALKLLETTTDREKANALAEIRYLASIQHPNVISYKAAFIDEASSCLCLVMEYASGGDLSQKVKAKKHAKLIFGEDTILFYLAQMALGM